MLTGSKFLKKTVRRVGWLLFVPLSTYNTAEKIDKVVLKWEHIARASNRSQNVIKKEKLIFL